MMIGLSAELEMQAIPELVPSDSRFSPQYDARECSEHIAEKLRSV